MGSSGWEAYTIGFTLVGCIIACAGLGWFLDNKLGTSYWLPILFLVGVAAGFREMFVVLNRISKEQEKQRQEAREQERVVAKNMPATPVVDELQNPEGGRQRIFSVPPPPLSGEAPTETTANSEEDESVEQLIQKLLGESDDELENESDDPDRKRPQ